MVEYTVLLIPDPDRSTFTVECPVLPGLVTEGRNREEALAMAREAIELHLESLTARGLPVPRETARPELASVAVEVSFAAVAPAGATS